MIDKQTNKLQLIYIFPSLFTAASAFVGVISIFASVKGDYEKAVIYIILSLILDGLDGRVARFTNTMSKFGAEFDSLADIVAFGVAPAVLFYYSIGINFGKFGSLMAAIFVVFGAVRLARFNITSSQNEPSVFIGIPIPSAAVIIAMWVLVYEKYPSLAGIEYFIIFLQGLLSFLMVSNVRYPSFKKINFQKSNVIKILAYLIVFASIIYLYPAESVTLLITAYMLFGLGRGGYTIFQAKFKKCKHEKQDSEEETTI